MKKDLNTIARGKDYWRSLDELADSPEFRKFVESEFPEEAGELSSGLSRRKFLSVMGASLAFAGLSSCRRPVEKIVPYVKAPAEGLPGEKLFYATAHTHGLSAQGQVVESHVGRPTKIEGSTRHDLVNGKSNTRMQASVLNLYDPDRSSEIIHDGAVSWIEAFVEKYSEIHKASLENGGQDLALIMPSFASPSLNRQLQLFRDSFPAARIAAWDPVSDENVHRGIELAAGKKMLLHTDLSKAKVILGLDSDFLHSDGEDLYNAAGYAQGRRVRSENDPMSRYYAVESAYSISASNADHRLRMKSSEIPLFTLKLAHTLNHKGRGLLLPEMPADAYFTPAQEKWISVLAEDLENNRGECLILAGRNQSPELHALVYALNELLGNSGRTVRYYDAEDTVFPDTDALKSLAADLDAGNIQTLILFDSNPAYWAPADLKMSSRMKKAGTLIHFSAYLDESSPYADWHIPAAHYLESWGDARALDGQRLIVQPLIAPLFNGSSALSFLHLLATAELKSDFELLQEGWKELLPADTFDKDWMKLLSDGVYSATAYSHHALPARQAEIKRRFAEHVAEKRDANGLEVNFRPHSSLFDGRHANNGWLQELPDPISKIAWDNPAWISAATAEKYGVENGDMVAVSLNGATVDIPVWIVPGHADGCVTLHLGFGRWFEGRIAKGTGFNVYTLRSSDKPYTDFGAGIMKLRSKHAMANTQDHGSMEGRPLIREASLEEYRNNPEFAPDMVKHPPLKSLWEEHPYDEGYQWGMVIDLNACIGCNACTIACQSENNIPVVGREMVEKGREMHWIRLDRYFSGDIDDPQVAYQPLGCQHCENAPCEQVCPVAATSHDEEGLNVMTYNRCIGTRYCANNCPYKVRRFNFYNFTKDTPETLKMAMNPEVSVRFRGVMEKCTFCTQRINNAKIQAKNEGRGLKDGDVQTACQQSCPTHAISFGNILDQKAEVTVLKGNNRNYAMLAELNIKPRNTYLAKLRNPHPALSAPKTGPAEHGKA